MEVVKNIIHYYTALVMAWQSPWHSVLAIYYVQRAVNKLKHFLNLNYDESKTVMYQRKYPQWSHFTADICRQLTRMNYFAGGEMIKLHRCEQPASFSLSSSRSLLTREVGNLHMIEITHGQPRLSMTSEGGPRMDLATALLLIYPVTWIYVSLAPCLGWYFSGLLNNVSPDTQIKFQFLY